jgi:uncharacterized OsmC-like protein
MATTVDTSVKWAVKRDDGPIVVKAERLPELEAMTFEPAQKPRMGEPIRFQVNVVAEPTSLQGKRAFVGNNGHGWSDFEIYCDEGTPLGGEDKAPSPLAYFTAGAAFCLLTHISSYVRMKKLDIDRIKLEVKGKYMTTMGQVATGGQGSGACEGFETHVIIDSTEPAEKVKQLVEVCENACMAMQTVVNAVPASTSLILNGKKI